MGGVNASPNPSESAGNSRRLRLAGSRVEHPFRALFEYLQTYPDVPELRGLIAGAINGYDTTPEQMGAPIAWGIDSEHRAVVALAVCQFHAPGGSGGSVSTRPAVVSLHAKYPSDTTDRPDIWVATVQGGAPAVVKPGSLTQAIGAEGSEFVANLLVNGRASFAPLDDPSLGQVVWTLMDQLPRQPRRAKPAR